MGARSLEQKEREQWEWLSKSQIQELIREAQGYVNRPLKGMTSLGIKAMRARIQALKSVLKRRFK